MLTYRPGVQDERGRPARRIAGAAGLAASAPRRPSCSAREAPALGDREAGRRHVAADAAAGEQLDALAGARRRPRARRPTTSSSTSTSRLDARARADHEAGRRPAISPVSCAVDAGAAPEREQALELGAGAEHGHGVFGVAHFGRHGAHVRPPSRMRAAQPVELLGAEVLDLDAPALGRSLDAHPRLERAGAAASIRCLQVGVLAGSRARSRCGRARRRGRERARELLRRAHRELLARRCGRAAGGGARGSRPRAAPSRGPIVSAPASTSAWSSRGSSSRRRWFAIVERSRPTRSPISSCVAPASASARNASASSIGLRSRRCTFSTSATSSRSRGSTSCTTAGIVARPGALRRAPASLADDELVAARAARARTTTGWSTPCARIESARRVELALVEAAARLIRVRLDVARSRPRSARALERGLGSRRGRGCGAPGSARRGRDRARCVGMHHRSSPRRSRRCRVAGSGAAAACAAPGDVAPAAPAASSR